MEIRLLRYFVEIAREGNMTRAAQKLHVSQSALSKQMKELESDLHHELFRRTRAGLILTDAGMMLRNAIVLKIYWKWLIRRKMNLPL